MPKTIKMIAKMGEMIAVFCYDQSFEAYEAGAALGQFAALGVAAANEGDEEADEDRHGRKHEPDICDDPEHTRASTQNNLLDLFVEDASENEEDDAWHLN